MPLSNYAMTSETRVESKIGENNFEESTVPIANNENGELSFPDAFTTATCLRVPVPVQTFSPLWLARFLVALTFPSLNSSPPLLPGSLAPAYLSAIFYIATTPTGRDARSRRLPRQSSTFITPRTPTSAGISTNDNLRFTVSGSRPRPVSSPSQLSSRTRPFPSPVSPLSLCPPLTERNNYLFFSPFPFRTPSFSPMSPQFFLSRCSSFRRSSPFLFPSTTCLFFPIDFARVLFGLPASDRRRFRRELLEASRPQELGRGGESCGCLNVSFPSNALLERDTCSNKGLMLRFAHKNKKEKL